jgi:predicted RNA binding protein YcfA (HicA-like mRNA interferase family)
MVRPQRILEKVLAGSKTLPFRDFEKLLKAFGFRLDRIAGSHRIYTHPRADRPLSVQPRGKEAKPYQVRQFLDMIETHGISLDGEK